MITTMQETKKIFGNVIGSGTYGTVWNVINPDNGKRLAVKHIKNVFKHEKTALAVYRELKIMSNLKHDNVVTVIDVIQPFSLAHFQEIYFTMELMYCSLFQVLTSKQKLTVIQTEVLFYQLMRGLVYIHSARIIHRDIKPENILLRCDWVLKLCDFGFARKEAPQESNRRLTLKVGTPYYNAPEILMMAKHYTTAIDVWSAACVFAELLGCGVLFKTQNTCLHVVKIICLLGTPPLTDINYASESMKLYVSCIPTKPSNLSVLCQTSNRLTYVGVDLLGRMMHLNPDKRLTAVEVMKHVYMDSGRKRYHSEMCECCVTQDGRRCNAAELEPCASEVCDDGTDETDNSREKVKERMFRYIRERQRPGFFSSSAPANVRFVEC